MDDEKWLVVKLSFQSDRVEIQGDPLETVWAQQNVPLRTRCVVAYIACLTQEITRLTFGRKGVHGEHLCLLCDGVRVYGVTENGAFYSECANRECALPVFRKPGEYSLQALTDPADDR